MRRMTTVGGSVLLAVAGQRAMAESQKAAPPPAVIAGYVYRDSGFALADAEVGVALNPDDKPAAGLKPKWRSTTNSRGEFSLRLPPGPARYTVIVKAEGYRSQDKTVSVMADDRIDLNFILDPAARP